MPEVKVNPKDLDSAMKALEGFNFHYSISSSDIKGVTGLTFVASPEAIAKFDLVGIQYETLATKDRDEGPDKEGGKIFAQIMSMDVKPMHLVAKFIVPSELAGEIEAKLAEANATIIGVEILDITILDLQRAEKEPNEPIVLNLEGHPPITLPPIQDYNIGINLNPMKAHGFYISMHREEFKATMQSIASLVFDFHALFDFKFQILRDPDGMSHTGKI
jgi:hypothetical protein